MRIGRLNQRITVQRPSTSLDAYGQRTDAWQTVATVWAQIQSLRSKESLQAMVMNSETLYKITTRYSAALLPPQTVSAWRIVYGSRIFNIVSVANTDEDNKQLVFTCTEGSIDGT
jgi:SPP1 family predicted phage head-tail adaptor